MTSLLDTPTVGGLLATPSPVSVKHSRDERRRSSGMSTAVPENWPGTSPFALSSVNSSPGTDRSMCSDRPGEERGWDRFHVQKANTTGFNENKNGLLAPQSWRDSDRRRKSSHLTDIYGGYFNRSENLSSTGKKELTMAPIASKLSSPNQSARNSLVLSPLNGAKKRSSRSLSPAPFAMAPGFSPMASPRVSTSMRRSRSAQPAEEEAPAPPPMARMCSLDEFVTFKRFSTGDKLEPELMEELAKQVGDVEIEVTDSEPSEPPTPMPVGHELATEWALWEHIQADIDYNNIAKEELENQYESACRHVKSFGTIEQFMTLWNGMPAPSVVLNKNKMIRKSSDDAVENIGAHMLFREGINPTWEDEANSGGGHFLFVFKSDFPQNAIDEIWERVAFSVLGNILENGDKINGLRIADKYQAGFHSNTACTAVRMEVWHKNCSEEVLNALRKEIQNIFKAPLSCGGLSKIGRMVRKGERATKATMSYESKEEQNFFAANRRLMRKNSNVSDGGKGGKPKGGLLRKNSNLSTGSKKRFSV